MAQKLDTRAFIEKARAVHGERYDYSRVEYVTTKQKVDIICPVHGEFSQTPRGHLRGFNCYKCEGIIPYTVDSFIAKARAVHGERYDYSRAEFINGDNKIIIICPVHGEFFQISKSHLKGYGCRLCAAHKRAAGIENFISKARNVHGDKYDYSKAVYVSVVKRLTIICPEHGEFLLTPAKHLSGSGCQTCTGGKVGFSRSNWIAAQRGRKATLYIILLESTKELFYKVGITYMSLERRFNSSAMPYKFRIVALYSNYEPGSIYNLEKIIHRKLSNLKYKPALNFGGQTECFSSIETALHLLPSGTLLLKESSS